VKTEPKTGSSEFYRGYTDGYEGEVYDDRIGTDRIGTWTENKNYDEGYTKGEADSEIGFSPRYQYVSTPAGWTRHTDGKVSPPPGTVFTAQDGAWPFPN
jgi:hypothetical protein